MKPAYYNEVDGYAAAWLRNLVSTGFIPAGDVDERDIRDVAPSDLSGYGQCHFFAGIGVWSYALRLAGWPDDRAVWTGSCPCQPFSTAGRSAGFADKRHLWPHWHHLIEIRRPPIVFGEQVESKDGLKWFDLVQADLEGSNYACGAVDICAAGVGAPHIRQRLWFVGVADDSERRAAVAGGDISDRPSSRWDQGDRQLGEHRQTGGMGDAQRLGTWRDAGAIIEAEGRSGVRAECYDTRPSSVAGPVNGFWRGADWIPCRDDKCRPVEPGTFPLVDGAAFSLDGSGTLAGKSRAKTLKGFGNAIVPQVAAEVIAAFMETTP